MAGIPENRLVPHPGKTDDTVYFKDPFMETDISLNHVTFAYRQQPILENVSLTVPKNEFACIVGPNGGGKTTLLKLILGLIQPDDGQILVLGTTPEKARNRMGYMPQYAHLDMTFPATVRDVVLMGRLKQRGFWFSAKDRARAMDAIATVGMTPLPMSDSMLCPADNGSGFSLPEHCAAGLRFFCWTNPPPTWIMKPKKTCSPSSSLLTGR